MPQSMIVFAIALALLTWGAVKMARRNGRDIRDDDDDEPPFAAA